MNVQAAIEYAFGTDSEQAKAFRGIRFSSNLVWHSGSSGSASYERYAHGLSQAEGLLKSLIHQVREYFPDDQEAANLGREDPSPPDNRKVFVVHGRDEGTKHEVARFVKQLDLEPVVLSEMPNEGKTIMEKFVAHSDVGFAIVLLMSDDSGALQGDEPRPRARQNVIFELGFFIGKLGRKCVCALTRGAPEIPSDYAGVLYVQMDKEGAWKVPLMKELRKAGLDVDANKAVD